MSRLLVLFLVLVSPVLGAIEAPIVSATDATNVAPPFVCGLSAAARVLPDGTLAHVSAAPLEAFRSVGIELPGRPVRTDVYPNRVVRVLETPDATLTCTYFAAHQAPWAGLIVESVPSGSLTLKLRPDPHAGWLSKFRGRRGHDVAHGAGQIQYTRNDGDGSWAAISTDGELADDLTTTWPNGRGAILFSAGGAGNEPPVCDLKMVKEELRAVEQAEAHALAEGMQLHTPDAELNRFFRLSRIWFRKDCRRLPMGAPHAADATHNASLDLLTASPDYHGVFANDCVQTALEGMLVAPDLLPVYVNGLDTLHSFGFSPQLGYLPESVEMVTGRSHLFVQGLRIGQHPEWIAALCSTVLLSGDRELGERLWPGVELASRFFLDANGDGVNEWDTAGYPEQPDTRGYQSGMLYAQAWWAWAWQLAAETARYMERPDAETYAQRARAAREAMERVFGREDGYGSWLSPKGELHPHHGHGMILPLALGLAPRERAERVIQTMRSPEVWLEPYGPRRADVASKLRGGDVVWGFMRWNFIAALCEAGQVDEAVRLAGIWARQELAMGVPAPESFPRPITGITGGGYVWTAGRALRALSFGLFGLAPTAEGLRVEPRLPAGWKNMLLEDIPLRGHRVTIEVRDGTGQPTLNGDPWTTAPTLNADKLTDGENRLVLYDQE